MKRLLAVTVFGVAVMGGVAYSTRVQAQPEERVDETLINAKVDARLRQVLGELRRQTTSRAHEMALIGR